MKFYIKDDTRKITFKTDNPEVCNFGIEISHKLIQSGCKTIQYCLKTKLTIKKVFFSYQNCKMGKNALSLMRFAPNN